MSTSPAGSVPAQQSSLGALHLLAERWSAARAAERANAQSYIIELCEALELPRPQPAGSGYEFEYPMKLASRDGTESQGFVDLYRTGCFVLEAKDYDAGGGGDLAMRRAYGQARMYASNDPSGIAPPYLLVLDVAKTLMVFHRWNGTFQGFATGHRIDLPSLHTRIADVQLLRDIWQNPTARDPRIRAQAVTTDIAEKLAKLAAALEQRDFGQERVARFLMRVVFSCFAEDVGLLPKDTFRQTVQNAGVNGDPARFAKAVAALWKAMDEGEMFGSETLLRFNGHFFRDAEALPLTREEIILVLEAARADWADVEPSIFGTLLTRALDAAERHRLGAEYTPRSFIERLIRPTVEEPVRERWTAVQVEALQLRETGRPKDRVAAADRIRQFLSWMRGLRVLDPACGSGNFLYVTMHLLKDIEYEAVQELVTMTGVPELRMEEIGPWNFLGLEVKPWAREIAELTLWIGFHQYWRKHHAVQPPEPVLQDTGTLECRDAILTWDAVRHDPARDRPDPTPRIVHHVTGELVPDPARVLAYEQYEGASPAPWPAADFIVGNPPYLGQFRQRDSLGDGYVDALRAAYPAVPDSADLVMYWWYRAAELVASGAVQRAGLITTNSITQRQNRTVIADAERIGARVTWAVADHVWYDGGDGAEVRVAMTVIALDPPDARLVRVQKSDRVVGEVRVLDEVRVHRLNANLTADADVARASTEPLLAMQGVSSRGFSLHGAGFILTPADAAAHIRRTPELSAVIRPYRNGKDLTARPRGVWLIDFGLMMEAEARQYPTAFDIVRDRVKPERDANPRAQYATSWWRFGEPRRELRAALAGLPRYIATPETSKHRLFTFLDASIAPDNSIVCIAVDESFVLGVLSSSVHQAWALAAGGRMGVRDTPRYNKGACFESFPFPTPTPALRARISALAVDLESHRAKALAADSTATLMKMYDVVEALRQRQTLTPAQRALHAATACGVLNDLHLALDAAVLDAYDLDDGADEREVLNRLVLLHDARAEEEQDGRVHWLRPGYQANGEPGPRGIARPTPRRGGDADVSPRSLVSSTPWPPDAIGQITSLRSALATRSLSVDELWKLFPGAKRELVARHTETLVILGEVHATDDGRYTLASVTY